MSLEFLDTVTALFVFAKGLLRTGFLTTPLALGRNSAVTLSRCQRCHSSDISIHINKWLTSVKQIFSFLPFVRVRNDVRMFSLSRFPKQNIVLLVLILGESRLPYLPPFPFPNKREGCSYHFLVLPSFGRLT